MLPSAGTITHLSTAGGFPTIVATSNGAMLIAWEENGAISTARM